MALGMHKAKAISKATPQGPRRLDELCHDALLNGVITKHGKLPDSVVDILKGDPSVMQQLTALVIDSSKRETKFHRESVVAIVSEKEWIHQESQEVVPEPMMLVKAHALPGWLLRVFEAYHAIRLQLEGTKWERSASVRAVKSTPHEGYVFCFYDYHDVMKVWNEMVAWTMRWPTEAVCQKVFWELCNDLLHLFGKDHEREYGDVMRQYEANVGDSEYFDDWSGDAIAEFFQKRTRKILRTHIKGICGRPYAEEWLDNMGCHKNDFEQWGSCALQPVPYMTLRFNMQEYGERGPPGLSHSDDNDSDDDHDAFA